MERMQPKVGKSNVDCNIPFDDLPTEHMKQVKSVSWPRFTMRGVKWRVPAMHVLRFNCVPKLSQRHSTQTWQRAMRNANWQGFCKHLTTWMVIWFEFHQGWTEQHKMAKIGVCCRRASSMFEMLWGVCVFHILIDQSMYSLRKHYRPNSQFHCVIPKKLSSQVIDQ